MRNAAKHWHHWLVFLVATGILCNVILAQSAKPELKNPSGPPPFVVAVAQFANDPNNHDQKLALAALTGIFDVKVVALDHLVDAQGPGDAADLQKDHGSAQKILGASGAQALLWGVASQDQQAEAEARSPKLFWTSRPNGIDRQFGITELPPEEDLQLPRVLWPQMETVLKLLAATGEVEWSTIHESGPLFQFTTDARYMLGEAGAISPLDAEQRSQVLFLVANAGAALGWVGSNQSWFEYSSADYREGLQEQLWQHDPLRWAMTENYLGNVLDGMKQYDDAAAAYREALTGLKPKASPASWSIVQNNLAQALLWHGNSDQTDAGPKELQQAIDVYRELLSAGTEGNFPYALGRSQQGLGDALSILGNRVEGYSRKPMLEEGVTHYHEALKILTKDRFPRDFAYAQVGMAQALEHLADGEQDRALHDGQAILAYRQALLVWTKESNPDAWADVQNNMGVALMQWGENDETPSAQQELSDAATTFRELSTAASQKGDDEKFATAQLNLGGSLKLLADLEPGTDRYEDALVVLRTGLEVESKNRNLELWLKLQRELGLTLENLGVREIGTQDLEEAIQAHNLVLNEQEKDKDPFAWAATEENLAHVYTNLGERDSSDTGSANLKKAVEAYDAALTVDNEHDYPLGYIAVRADRAVPLMDLGERDPSHDGTKLLEDAMVSLRKKLTDDPSKDPYWHAFDAERLGDVLIALGKRGTGTDLLEQAVGYYKKALKDRSSDTESPGWAERHRNLSDAEQEIAARKRNPKEFCGALSERTEAWKMFGHWQFAYDESKTAKDIANGVADFKSRFGQAALDSCVGAQPKIKDFLANSPQSSGKN